MVHVDATQNAGGNQRTIRLGTTGIRCFPDNYRWYVDPRRTPTLANDPPIGDVISGGTMTVLTYKVALKEYFSVRHYSWWTNFRR